MQFLVSDDFLNNVTIVEANSPQEAAQLKADILGLQKCTFPKLIQIECGQHHVPGSLTFHDELTAHGWNSAWAKSKGVTRQTTDPVMITVLGQFTQLPD